MDKLKELVQTKLVAKELNQREYRRGKPAGFYPSSVGMCTRAIVYGMLGYERKPPEARSLLILANGTSFHERFEGILEQSGIQIAAELPIELPDLMIRGRSDSIIKNVYDHEVSSNVIQLKGIEGNVIYEGPDSEVMVTELKSIKDKSFDYIVNSGSAKEEHIQQIMIYMYALKIPQGVLVYENKNTQELYMYPVKMDESILNFVLNKIRTVIEYYNRKELPNKEFMRSSYECTYCDFKDYCWEQMRQLTLDEILSKIEVPE